MPTQNTPKDRKKKKDRTKAEATKRRLRSVQADPSQAAPQQGGEEFSKYAPTTWGSAAGGPVDLELPSGQLVLARNPGVEGLMKEGVLHNMDNLTALVDSKHIKKGKPGTKPKLNVGSFLQDEEQLKSVLHTVDRVLCAVVLRPPVAMTPNDPTRRQMGVIYADTVEITDKMFIFNWALGGSRDIERFRRESAEVVGDLAVGEPVGEGAE